MTGVQGSSLTIQTSRPNPPVEGSSNLSLSTNP